MGVESKCIPCVCWYPSCATDEQGSERSCPDGSSGSSTSHCSSKPLPFHGKFQPDTDTLEKQVRVYGASVSCIWIEVHLSKHSQKKHLGYKETTFSCIISCGPSTLRLSTCCQVKACNICNLNGPERVWHKHVALRCFIFIWDVNQDRLKNKIKLDLKFSFFNAGSSVDWLRFTTEHI